MYFYLSKLSKKNQFAMTDPVVHSSVHCRVGKMYVNENRVFQCLVEWHLLLFQFYYSLEYGLWSSIVYVLKWEERSGCLCLDLQQGVYFEWSKYLLMLWITDYGRPVRKSPSLHGQKSNPNHKFLGTAKAYFVCHIGPNFQISLI